MPNRVVAAGEDVAVTPDLSLVLRFTALLRCRLLFAVVINYRKVL